MGGRRDFVPGVRVVRIRVQKRLRQAGREATLLASPCAPLSGARAFRSNERLDDVSPAKLAFVGGRRDVVGAGDVDLRLDRPVR